MQVDRVGRGKLFESHRVGRKTLEPRRSQLANRLGVDPGVALQQYRSRAGTSNRLTRFMRGTSLRKDRLVGLARLFLDVPRHQVAGQLPPQFGDDLAATLHRHFEVRPPPRDPTDADSTAAPKPRASRSLVPVAVRRCRSRPAGGSSSLVQERDAGLSRIGRRPPRHRRPIPGRGWHAAPSRTSAACCRAVGGVGR